MRDLSDRHPSPYLDDSRSSTALGLSSTSAFPGAPTPFNTFIETQIDSTVSDHDQEIIEEPPLPRDTSIRPSLASLPSVTSSYPNASLSSRSGSHLLRFSSSDSISLPRSTRPVPAPPTILRNGAGGENGIAQYSHTDRSSFSHASTPATPGSGKSLVHEEVTVGHAPMGMKQGEVDAHRSQQLGYDPVLGRDYTFWSSSAISTINIGCLQGVVFGVAGAYSYGGPMMLLVAWPLSGFFAIFLTLALAEQASAYPVSGAMASWAWKLARGGVGGERGWGWLMGGVVLGGHSGNVSSVAWEITSIIEGTMSMAFNYEPQGWHSVCFYLAVMVVSGFIGSSGWGRSHRFWSACGAFGIAVYSILNVSSLTTVVRHPEHHISRQFFNTTGWSSRAYVYILGWQFTCIATGADASAHMAEETQRPARNVPNAMVCSMIISYVLGYISMVLLLLAVRAEDIVEISRHHFPFGHILERAINTQGAIAICSSSIVLLTFQVHAQLQASSRFVFSSARDNAMPFSEAIRRTNSTKQPVVANWVVVGSSVPFCSLTMAGKGTLYSVLAVTAMSSSYWGYVVPVMLYSLSGKDLQTEGRSSWSSRRFSKPAACMGILYGLAVIITQMLPGKRPVTAQSISWSPVILVGTGLICLITWKLYGDKHYSGPIRALTKWETGVEIDSQSALASQRSRRTNSGGNSSETPKASAYSASGHTGTGTRVAVESAEDESVWTDATESRVTQSTITRSRGTQSDTVERISEDQDGEDRVRGDRDHAKTA